MFEYEQIKTTSLAKRYYKTDYTYNIYIYLYIYIFPVYATYHIKQQINTNIWKCIPSL